MSTALFSNNIRGVNKNLVELKAGKMTMKGTLVLPDNRKGQLYIYQSDDSLMHFCWKDRTTGIVEDDLIIFPDDCEFKHVTQCTTGRVYLLKFKSSNRKFFFWLQDLLTEKDEEHCRKINELLNNPPSPGLPRSTNQSADGDLQNLLNNMSQQQLMQLFGGVGQIGGFGSLLGSMNRSYNGSRLTGSTSVSKSATSAPSLSAPSNTIKESSGERSDQSTAVNETAATSVDTKRIRLRDLQNFLTGIPNVSDNQYSVQRWIANELTMAIPPAIATCENLEMTVKNYLPSGDNLSTTLSSPQFSQALSMFWSAFQAGQVAPIIEQFGLASDAVNAAASGNIEQFIKSFENTEKKKECLNDNYSQATLHDISASNSVQDSSKDDSRPSNPKKKDEDDEGMSLD